MDNINTEIENQVLEIQSMREEINWRVKSAYNASIIFISALTFIIGTVFQGENKLLTDLAKNPVLFCEIQIGAIILFSAWAGVQNVNHLIEKKIELYSLSLIKKIHSLSGNVHSSWLGYLYGSRFFKGKINGPAKFISASIGVFIYLLPNLVTLILWIDLLYKNAEWNSTNWFRISFFTSTISMIASVGSAFLFFFYVIRVNNNYTAFYRDVMCKYFDYEDKK